MIQFLKTVSASRADRDSEIDGKVFVDFDSSRDGR